MKISEQWLREWVSPEASTEELAVRLTMAGLEVESVEPAGAAVHGVVSAEVRGVSPHPDAERLRVCRVSTARTNGRWSAERPMCVPVFASLSQGSARSCPA